MSWIVSYARSSIGSKHIMAVTGLAIVLFLIVHMAGNLLLFAGPDALNHPVQWQNSADLSALVGKQVRLKCYMTRARIHAMTLCNNDRPLGEIEPEFREDLQGDSAPTLT